jgi:hypothetical protein
MYPVHISGRVPVDDYRSRPVVCLTFDSGWFLRVLMPCGSRFEHEKMWTMTTLTIDPAEALAPFGDSAVIPLPEIGAYLGWNRDTRNDLVKNNLIHTATFPETPGRTRGRKVLVDRDEALLIITAALLASALGLAIATVIRGLRNSEATITADTVNIPLPGLNTMNKVKTP